MNTGIMVQRRHGNDGIRVGDSPLPNMPAAAGRNLRSARRSII